MDNTRNPGSYGKKKKAKMQKKDKYKSLDKEIKAKYIEIKECWISEQCVELKDLERKDIQIMYSKIKKI